MSLSITKANYQKEVIECVMPVVVDVFAVWCGPCQMMKPTFTALEQKFSGKYKFVTLNVEEDRELSTDLGITSIPSFLFFNKGKLLGKEVGMIGQDAFVNLLDTYFKE